MTLSNEQKEPESNNTKTLSTGYWTAVGLAIGAGIGVALDNLAIGAAMGADQNQKNKNK